MSFYQNVRLSSNRCDGDRSAAVRPSSVVATALLAIIGIALAAKDAYPALPTCGSQISTCCKIISPGNYTISGEVNNPGLSDACIKIWTTDVTVDGSDEGEITGALHRSMTGIVVEPGAYRAQIKNLNVNNFNIGIKIDAATATLDSVLGVANMTGILVNGKSTRVVNTIVSFSGQNGIVINGIGFLGSILNVHHSGRNGIVFNPTAAGPVLLDSQVFENGQTGIKLIGFAGGLFDGIQATGNSIYGIQLRGVTGASLADVDASYNGLAGVYFGCQDVHGPSNTSCPTTGILTPARGNYLASFKSTSQATTQQYGVAIDVGNFANRVTGITASSNTVDDLYDRNSQCDSNLWLRDTFGTSNKSCIH